MGLFDWLTKGWNAEDRRELEKSPTQRQQENRGQAGTVQYELPPCCQAVLKETQLHSRLLGGAGVLGASMQMMGNVDTKTPKTLFVNWSDEGQTASDVATAIAGINVGQALEKAVTHRDKHADDRDGDPYQFWNRVVKRLMADPRLPSSRRQIEEAMGQP